MPNIVEFNAGVSGVPSPRDNAMATAREAASAQDRFAHEGGRAIGSSISQVGGQIGKEFDAETNKRIAMAEQHQIHQLISSGSVGYSSLYGDLTVGWNQTASKAPLNDTSIAQGFSEHTLEPSLAKFRASFDNAPEAVQKWADERVASTRQHFTEKMIADSGTRAAAAVHQNSNDLLTNYSNLLTTDPSALKNVIANIDTDIGQIIDTSPNLSPAEAARLRAEVAPKMKVTAAVAAFDGMARDNPLGAIKLLDSGKFNDYLNEDQQRIMRSRAESIYKTQLADSKREQLAAKQERQDVSVSKADVYMNSMIDPSSGRMRRPDPKLNQKIMEDPDLLPAQKMQAIRWNQTQYHAQVREDKEAAAGSAVKDNPEILTDMRKRVNSIENPVTRQEVIDALGGEQITRKSAADMMWRVGQQDAAWQAVQRPFQHQFAVVSHGLTTSTAGQVNPEGTAQRILVMEADAQRKLRVMFDAKDQAGINDALDPTSKNYILRDSLIRPAVGTARDNVAEQAGAVRRGTLNQPKRFANEEEVKAAKVPDGTVVIVNGRRAVWNN